ncbi:MAG: FtsQ-type POTRA domain-containing protein [Methylococcales bacterium]|nr:FtsQ-type POTRA domain-containing protein [Methylococcales bacterium]
MNKKTINFVGIISILLAIGWFQNKLQSIDWLPVKYVRIEGAFQYIKKDKIKQALQQQVSHGLYGINLQQVQESVKQLPWVDAVSVKRVWPDTLNIKIKEQLPVARWRRDSLLNNNAEIFIPDNIEKFNRLPKLEGSFGNEKELLEVMKGLMITLTDQDLELKEFRVTGRRAWYLKLKNDMELVIGRNTPLNKFQRFIKTLGLIGREQVTKIAIVDLRYPNGYAITWKKGIETIEWKKIARMRLI